MPTQAARGGRSERQDCGNAPAAIQKCGELTASALLQLSLQSANESREAYLPFALELLGAKDRFDGFEGYSDIVIDDDVVVGVEMAHFVARLLHASADDVFRILRTGVQTLFQRCHRWRQDKYTDDVVGRAAAQLLRALPVDVEQNIVPGGKGRFPRRAWRAV